MTADALRGFSTRTTPQTQPAGNATVPNAAGGHGFAVDDLVQLKRFLVLGVTGGTYYTSGPDLARQSADVVTRMARSDARTLVDTIVEVSLAGRAPKQNPAIFALALAAAEADEAGRVYALQALPKVCRTTTHLNIFATYVEQFRGWGRGLRRYIGAWYNAKDIDKLTYQLLKYRQREGWRHADLLALSHPQPDDQVRDNLYRYVVDTMADGGPRDRRRINLISRTHRDRAAGVQVLTPEAAGTLDARLRTKRPRNVNGGQPLADFIAGLDHRPLPANTYSVPEWSSERVGVLPDLVGAYEQVQNASAQDAAALIDMYDLSWEMLPDRLINQQVVWEAMLAKGVPPTALIKQLPRLTRLGLTTGDTGRTIVGQLTDVQRLKWGRVHPINLLVAQRTYASGRSARGDSTWPPTPNVIDALHDGFYLSFDAVEPAGKRTLNAVDVSSSMSFNAAGGLPLKALEVAGALALVMGSTEPEVIHIGFNISAWPLSISKRQRLDDVLTYMRHQPNGGTDCAAPILWALQNRQVVDTFTLLTDEESWAGSQHPFQALRLYRERMNPNAKMVAVSMTPKGYSIIDPQDAGCCHVVGMDTNVPQMITDFSAGRI
jgi:60 kDa SS-A/Ro ribonucleoprotein